MMLKLNQASLNLVKYFGLVLVDTTLVPIALWLALSIRHGSIGHFSDSNWFVYIALIGISLPIFVRLGLYRVVVKFAGLRAIRQIAVGAATSMIVLLVITLLQNPPQVPRSTFAIYGVVLFCLMAVSRLGMRMAIQGFLSFSSRKRVAIYGAGSSGRLLTSMFRMGDEYRPVVFLDDDKHLHGREIAGLRVLDPSNEDIEFKLKYFGVDEILMSIPSASKEVRRDILNKLEPLPFQVRTVPDMKDILSGKARLAEIGDIRLDDLLGRDAVPPDPKLLGKCIVGKSVLVTGAGGSIGAELCRQVLELKPASLILYEQSEFALYAIEQELRGALEHLTESIELVPLLGSVTNRKRLEEVFKSFCIDTVYHAAAYKHVPLVEHNPVEGIWNNTFGTLYAAQVAMENNVDHFVLISTDKAVRPTNVMGGSKRLAEMVLQALVAHSSSTNFSMVRFGNVLGSSGSVVPLFRKQILSGGPVTVTHPEITRYFMTIPEAVALVIQAGAMSKGGDVFVLDMGKPVKILDLAKQLIHLEGLTEQNSESPKGDIEIQFSGLRPGEKLYEELLIGSNVSGTKHPKIMRAQEEMLVWDELEELLDGLRNALESFDQNEVRRLMKKGVSGYLPNGSIEDLIWKKKSAQTSPSPKVIPFSTAS